MNQFRFRAACRVDVEMLMSVLPDAIYEIRHLDDRLPDVQVDMITRLELTEVKNVLAQLPDHEVMIKSIATPTDYRDTFTGGLNSGSSYN